VPQRPWAPPGSWCAPSGRSRTGASRAWPLPQRPRGRYRDPGGTKGCDSCRGTEAVLGGGSAPTPRNPVNHVSSRRVCLHEQRGHFRRGPAPVQAPQGPSTLASPRPLMPPTALCLECRYADLKPPSSLTPLPRHLSSPCQPGVRLRRGAAHQSPSSPSWASASTPPFDRGAPSSRAACGGRHVAPGTSPACHPLPGIRPASVGCGV